MFATDGVTWAPGDVGAEPKVVLNGVRRCVWSVPLLERSLERERLRERPLEQSLPGWSMLRSDHEKRQRQRRRRRLRQQQRQRRRSFSTTSKGAVLLLACWAREAALSPPPPLHAATASRV